MTYFPLFPILKYQSEQPGSAENSKKGGWKKVESKECTVATLVIGFLIGLSLIGVGFSGLFASNFHPPQGISITNIILGVSATIPLFVALKLGFKPQASSFSNQNELVQQNQPVTITPDQIQREKIDFRTRVTAGYYASFKLSNTNIYYCGVVKGSSQIIEFELAATHPTTYVYQQFNSYQLSPMSIKDDPTP